MTELLAKERDLELVGVAASAEEALRAVEQCYPDVVTIDVAMPGMGGIGLLDHLPKRGGIRTIMLSGHIDAMADAMDHGADATFDKASILSRPKAFLNLVREVAAGKAPKAAGSGPV